MTEEEEIIDRPQSSQHHEDNPGSSPSQPQAAAAPDEFLDSISDNSVGSSLLGETERRFNAGRLAYQLVLLLIWAYAGFRVFVGYMLVQLLQRLQRMLDWFEPVLNSKLANDGQRSDPIVGWLIFILAYNLAVTVALIAKNFYLLIAYSRRWNCSSNSNIPATNYHLSAKQIKSMLRTMGTLLFYFVLLPEAIIVLVLSGMFTSIGQLVDKRVISGAVSMETALSISSSFGCTESEDGYHCWLPDEANMTQVSRSFYSPMRQHLRNCHLPEAFSQMFLIIVAFLVTHLIRGRGTWEVDHRQLLEQTAFLRLAADQQRKSVYPVFNSQNPEKKSSWRQKKNA